MSQDSISGPVRRARNSLSRREIVAGARAELSSAGIDGFTIRGVARRLGASPMAIYTHVASKELLLDLVLDSVLAEVALSPGDSGRSDASATVAWDDAIVAQALSLLDVLMRNPWAVPALMARPDPGEAAQASAERIIASAMRGGLDVATATTVFAAVIALIYGAAGFLAGGGVSDRQDRAEIVEKIMTTDAEEFPVTAQAADELAEYGSLAQLERALRALLRGFSAS